MRIEGAWYRRSGQPDYPVIAVHIRRADGVLDSQPFLIDTGADRTVLSGDSFNLLGLPPLPPSSGAPFAGVGGNLAFVEVATTLYLPLDPKTFHAITGQFAATTDPLALPISILGRDILDLFDVIISNRRDEIVFLSDPHVYYVIP